MIATYNIDRAHSGVHFSVRHLMISTVRGGFSGVNGTIVHDTENPDATTIEAEVDVKTITTFSMRKNFRPSLIKARR